MERKKIGVLVGSLRKGSYNRAIVNAAIARASEELEFHFIEIGHLPLYNEDLETNNPPQEWVNFRKQIAEMDGFLFATPEYNRSFPASLKNALDVGSRPYGVNMWDGKPAGVISVSIGAIGGAVANQHLRQPMTFLNLKIMPQPEVYVGSVGKIINENGEITDESTGNFLKTFMDAFASWVKGCC